MTSPPILRAGQCPACNQPFDPAHHTPMVSVVCGHSICKHCATHPSSAGPRESDTESSASDDPAVDDSPFTCPVCHKQLEGFVTNFEALATLQSTSQLKSLSSSIHFSSPAQSKHPDLTAVVAEDLVIDRSLIHFVRAPSNELGSGGSAVVYKGMYNDLPVAIKCVRTMSDSFTSEDRLRRELRSASRLKSPHIVEFRGAAWDFEDGPSSARNVLLVSELMAGGNLRQNLDSIPKERAGLSVECFVHIALQIARGIEYLHAEGLAHRDIKSANVLLTQALPTNSNCFSISTRAKIADFGLSKYIDKATGGGTVIQSIMEPGRLEATYAYLAPEAFGGDKSNAITRSHCDDDEDVRYDNMAKKRDIYALGILFWEMLTGAVPWGGVSLPDVYVRVCVRSDRPAPALDDKAVDRTFHRLIDRCWAQSPSRRPSARSIVAKLEKLVLKYPLADSNTAAAMESVSIVSWQAPSSNPSAAHPPSRPMPNNVSKEIGHSGEPQFPHESSLPYQKTPSLSPIRSGRDDFKSKVHPIGLDTSDTGLGHAGVNVHEQNIRSYDVDHSNVGGKGWTLPNYTNSVQATLNGASSNGNHQTAQHSSVTDSHEVAPTPQRRSMRLKQVDIETSEGNGIRLAPLGAPSNLQHSNTAQFGATGVSPAGSVSQNKTSATAVAATAAAIAAAKDRERKRDDLRQARAVAVTTAAARVALGTTLAGNNNTGAGPSAGVPDKEKSERAAVFADSDEEAEHFDPERAAADEAIAESNSALAASQPSGRKSISGTQPSGHKPLQTPLLSRVTGRPRSPFVRRPASPSKGRPHAPSGVQGRVSGEEESMGSHTVLRPAGNSNVTSAVPKLPPKSTRGRLGRTLSASASGGPVARLPGGSTSKNSGTAAAQGGASAATSGLPSSGAGYYGSATMPVSASPSMHENASGQARSNAGLVASSSASTEETGRKAFIQRMRSNEGAKMLVKSPSSGGVEHRRLNENVVAGGGSGPVGMHRRPPSSKSRSLHISGSGRIDDDPGREGDTGGLQGYGMGIKTNSLSGVPAIIVGGNAFGGGGSIRENFLSLVDSMDKMEIIQALTQRMQPLRQSAIALAGLLSARHRNDEEVLRNCCLRLHRLTVPQGSSSSQSTASGQHYSTHQFEHHSARQNGGQGISEKEQASIRKYLKSRQGVEALLQALHPPQVRHPTTLCYGLLALGNLTAWDLEAHRQFRTSHGVVQVTQVMKAHSTNVGVQEKGCYALACVGQAYPPKSKSIFEESGGLDVVIRALSQVRGYECNEAVIKQACAALGAMCSSCPSNALYAGRKGALGYLVMSFDRFRKASKGESGGKRSEMRVACKSFVDLLCDEENRRDAGIKGGCTMMIRAMRIFRLDSDFIEKGLMTLTQFCAVRSNGLQILQANGVDDVVAAMDRFKMAEAMQKEGCRLLTALMRVIGDQSRRKMVSAGGAECVVFALMRFGGEAETNEEVVLEACHCLSALFTMANVAEGEALGRHMRKIRCDKAIRTAMLAHRGDAEIQRAARDALKLLSALRGGGLWSRMRSGSKKR